MWYNEINNERGKLMSQIKIGDFVTGYGSGYWQLIDIKPHIATEDYDSDDIHIFVLPEYRGKHFMSKIHNNGILKAELHPKQKVSLNINDIESFDDFLMKHYLISKIGLKISNLEKIHNSFSQLESSNDYCGFSNFYINDFLEKFS